MYIHFKIQNTTLKYLINRRVEHGFKNKSESRTFSFLAIDFNFGRHKDLSTLKSDIHLGRSSGR